MPKKRVAPSEPPRPTIAAHLSQESYDALMAFTAENGTTVAALLEAMGERLKVLADEGRPLGSESGSDAWLVPLLENARRIAAERRRRR